MLATAVKTDALARYPFSLIPTFFVPIALILHLLSLRTLRRGQRPRREQIVVAASNQSRSSLARRIGNGWVRQA